MKSDVSKADVIVEVKNSKTHTTNSFHFSRFQFESLLILWPASVVAGFMATGILVYDYTLVRPNLILKQKTVSYPRDEHQISDLASVRTSENIATQPLNGMNSAPASSEANSRESMTNVVSEPTNAPAIVDATQAEVSPVVSNLAPVVKENAAINPQSQNSEINQVADKTTLNAAVAPLQNTAADDLARPTQAGSQSTEPTSHASLEAEVLKAQKLMDENIAKQAESTATKSIESKSTGNPAKQSERILVSKDIQVEDLYSVHVEINQNSVNKQLTALLSMKNLTGRTERGRVWIKLLVSNGSKEEWLSSHVNLQTDAEMRALNSNVGKLYEFSYLLERMLTFGGKPTNSIEIKEIVLGTSTERHGQKVARYKVASGDQSL